MTDNKDNTGQNTPEMTSSQPYLIRAMYEWIVDNELTPYLMVDATKPGAIVPEDYLDDQGRIILNISPSATSELLMSNEEVTFNARFSGQAICIVVPTYCVKAIYARENGQGMMFNEEDAPTTGSNAAAKPKKRVQLESVSSGSNESVAKSVAQEGPVAEKPAAQGKKPSDGGNKKGPNLKVVK